jgi:hypothetical protein
VQVRTFFVNYRRKYNLDSVLKEYEQEAALKQKQQQRQKAVVGVTETAAVGEADANKEPKVSSTDSTNGVNGDNQNLSMDDDVMEVRVCWFGRDDFDFQVSVCVILCLRWSCISFCIILF